MSTAGSLRRLLPGLFLVAALPAMAQNPPGLDFSKVGIYAVDYDFLDIANLKFPAGRPPESYADRVSAAKERGQYVMLGLYTWDRVTHSKPLEDVFRDTDIILDAVNLDEVDMIFLNEEEVDWGGGLDYLNAIYDHVKARYDGPVYQWYSMPLGPRCDQKADGWVLDAYGFYHERFRKHVMKFIIMDKPVIVCINATPGVNSLQCSQEQVRVCEEFNIPVFYFAVHGSMGSVNLYMQSDDPLVARWRSWMLRVFDGGWRTDVRRLPTESAQHSFSADFELAGDEAGDLQWAEDFTTYGFIDGATIHGFLNLAWCSLEEAVWLKPAAEEREAEIIHHFSTPFGFTAPTAVATGKGSLQVELSADGRRWTAGETVETAGGTRAAANIPDLDGQNLWVRVRLKAGPCDEPQTILERIEVTGGYTAPEENAFPIVTLRESEDQMHSPRVALVPYEDDFRARRYLHLGEVIGEEDLTWLPGELRTRGADGRPVRVEIKQRFTSDVPLKVTRISLECMAQGSLAAHNELAFSLDGETPLAADSSVGRGRERDQRFDGALELDLGDDARARGVREFWVHLVMINEARRQTGHSNILRKLTVQAQVD